MTGNQSLDKILAALNVAIVGLSVGLIYYSHNIISPPPTDRGGELGSMIEKEMGELQKPPVVLEEIVVNLYSREARLRFLDTQMNIELYEEKDREAVMLLKPHIFDTLIDVAGNMSPNELNSVTGKILLETRVKNRVNDMVPNPVIRKILFSKFIIQ
ncbi:MAG: hypothetical protein CME62_01880 [Halobacteriovoraceae bacterium]|nr:hypothetical protein [Halobacteriovoraceae bacterium]|tara:strand:- start:14416 stop:14886 length:471 start_codon:yes stop_codon:yes gene_type:complete